MKVLSVTLFAGAVACMPVLHVSAVNAAAGTALHAFDDEGTDGRYLDAGAVDVGGALYDATEGKTDSDKHPKGDYGDVEYADPGYQDDRKPRYPIDTERHIRAAWSYIHREHNRSMYTAGQVAQIESRIIAAWKKRIDPGGPPSAAKDGKAD